jgi:uncharacterized protein YceK
MKAIKLLIAIALIISFTGCGTLLNLGEKESAPFGGVVIDSKIIAEGVPATPACWIVNIDVASFWPLALIDLPLSLVGDTLTLPIAVSRTNSIQGQQANR